MAKSLYDLFQQTVAKRGAETAALVKQSGVWRELTWTELDRLVTSVSTALVRLGVEPKQMVSVMSNTRLEWCAADLGILGAGATTVPIYQSSTPEDATHILNDAGSVAIFVEDEIQLAKVRALRTRVPRLGKVIAFTGHVDGPDEIPWDAFVGDGSQHSAECASRLRSRAAALTPADILTVIYTSGTTGPAKGAVITHDNMLYEAEAVEQIGIIKPSDRQYFFLPMAHVFAKVLEATWLRTGHAMAFWEGDMQKIVENLGEVHPTVVCSVPRIFEKVFARVVADAHARPGLAGTIARWGLEQEARAARAEQEGRTPGLAWSLARRLVFAKLHDLLATRFGGRLEFFVSGGAPLSRDIAYFFKHAGFKICEGYGLTESSAATCVNLPDDIRIGTVGRPLPGTELAIADDGEILIRGRGVMRGYHDKPEATAEAIDANRWLHTGDIGTLDPDGFLRITDRKKDIIVTAGGKKVAPQNLENLIKARSPLVSQAVVHGDRRKFLTVLLTIDPDALSAWARARQLAGDYSTLTRSERLHAEMGRVIEEVNARVASYETLKKFTILDHDFTVGDQLTPSLKVKRKLCNERYRAILDELYDAGADTAGTASPGADRGAHS